MNFYRRAGHMEALEPDRYKVYLKKAKKEIGAANLQFDTVAFSGMSGAIFAPVLALRLKKHLIMVRKKYDKYPTTHSEYTVEGYTRVQRYIIVDDFISTGASAKYIVDQIRDHFQTDAKCVGIYSYIRGMFYEPDYRTRDLIYRESSVPKIEAADDPTVATANPFACGCDWGTAQSCGECASSIAFNPFRFLPSIDDSDAPPEVEAMDLSS